MSKEKLIPKGLYCYVGEYVCPFWSMDSSKPAQANGYCSYLKKSDQDLNKEKKLTSTVVSSKNQNEIGKTLEDLNINLPLSLLWDQCKECDINTEEEIEE